MMRQWAIERFMPAGVGLAALLLALIAGFGWHSLTLSWNAATQEAHSAEVLRAIEKIHATTAWALAASPPASDKTESALLERPDITGARLKAALAEARELTQNNPFHQAQLERIHTLLSQPNTPAAPSGKRPSLNKDGAHPAVRIGAEWRTESLQQALKRMRREEERQAGQQRQVRITQLRWAQASGAVLLTCLFFFLLSTAFLLRRRARQDATCSEAILQQVLDLLPVGVFVTDRNGAFAIINPAARQLWGKNVDGGQESNYPAWRLHDGSKVKFEEYGLVRAFKNGEIRPNEEFVIEASDGSRKIVRSSAMPLRDTNGEIIGAIAVNMDVTDLQQAKAVLKAGHDALEARVAMRTRELVAANRQLHAEVEERRHAEQALRHTQNVLTSAQRLGQVGSWEINLATRQVRWSDELFRIFGLEPGAIEPSFPAALDRIHPDDRDMIANAAAIALNQGTAYKMVVRIVRSDDSLRYALAQAELLYDGEKQPTMLIGSVLDITEQRQTEEMLRELAVHQERIKEDERKRIAREIHDEMGQNLLALRIDVSMLHARTANLHPKLHSKVDMVLQNIDHTIRSVRAIINNLRPAVLDLGLHAAIQWQIEEFRRRNTIQCTLTADPNELERGLGEDQITSLFRVVQESLTNVARHAHAQRIDIHIYKENERLCMRIADDGMGIFPTERRKPKSFGLLGIRERISAIGGELEIDSIPGKGTILLLTIPLQQEAATDVEMEAANRQTLQQVEIEF